MKKNKNLKENTTINHTQTKNPQYNTKRQKVKERLIKQYNLSENEAEEKLKKIEKRVLQKKSKKQTENTVKKNDYPQKSKPQPTQNFPSNNVITSQLTLDREKNKNSQLFKENISKISIKKEDAHNYHLKPKNQNQQDKIIKKSNPKITKRKNNLKTSKQNLQDNQKQMHNEPKSNENVDTILEDLIPNYNPNVSIELNHVNLTFDIQEDRIDNLKEQIIRTIKRTKSKTTKFHVLNDITFKIYQGEKVGIIGYNGAGKSTLLKLITGIYKPDSGSLNTNGNISPLLSLGAGFDHNFSGARNIYLNAAVLGYDKKFIDEKYDEIVEFADLGKFINIPIRNYSSGMMAKLGFSIATIVDPDILIIDEILGVGDVNFQRKSKDKMKSLMGGKTTVLLVSHSINQIRELCDKAIWIDKGKVREIGEVNEVCDHYLKDSEKATKEQLKDIQFS